MPSRRQPGFTFTELMVSVAIVGILAAVAFPSYQEGIERKRIKAVAEALRVDMQFARTEAVKRSEDIKVSRISTGNPGDWCYGLTADTSCDCSATPSTCDIKTVDADMFSGVVSMQSGTANSTFTFRRGTIGANGVTLSTSDYDMRVVFGKSGRVRICIPPGAASMWDYPDC